jgi:hypothetical protein
MGTPMKWNRQYIVGSSISRRTLGSGDARTSWTGYREGYNRDSEGLDVIEELGSGSTVDGSRYDALLITEQHNFMDAILRNDTVRLLRHYHDRVVDGNSAATTYFYHSWLGVNDKSDPRTWIDYERAASRAWNCVATRVNTSLTLEGRSDRIVSLPAGAALATLVEILTVGSGVEGLTQENVRETLDLLFIDTVHLRPVGVYYIALVTYSAIYKRSPVGAWHPPFISGETARSLQQIAWEFVSSYYDNFENTSLDSCAQWVAREFHAIYWRYLREGYRSTGQVRQYLRSIRGYRQSRASLRMLDARNPFYFDVLRDGAHWYGPASTPPWSTPPAAGSLQ